MTLCDTGPLVAIIDQGDFHHERCVEALASIPAGEMMTTWPCLTEAMHLLRRQGGLRAQDALWSYVAEGFLKLYEPAGGEWQRMRLLMTKYGDAPMDLADASIVTACETLGQSVVFTLDRHFRAYRLRTGQSFQIVP